MLKRTIDADAYNALPDDVKSHYVKRGSKYVVDLEGTDPELVAVQTELDKARTTQVTLESQVRTLTADAAAVETRVRAEVEADLKATKEENAKLTESIITEKRDAIVEGIASNFTTPELIRGAVKERVSVEIKDGNVVTTIKDSKGNAVDLKALTDEYCKNPSYSGILKGKDNTGSFVPPTSAAGGGQQQQQNDKAFNYGTATPQEIAAHLESTIK